jgi:nucleoside-diphosphate-sugar epimerase
MQITIIGCGWLGLQLAESLIQKGNQVIGSTTQEKNLERLVSAGIEPFIFSDRYNTLPENALQSDLFVICIPPSKSLDYVKLIDHILHQLEQKKRVIFTSSTSVYLNHDGEVDEDGPINTESVLAQSEALVLNYATNNIVLRLAGLIGPNRNPGQFTSGKTLANAQAPVNLVDGRDVVRFIILLQEQHGSGIYNLCFPEHPRKATYYNEKCRQLNIAPPTFSDQSALGKCIRSKRVFEELAFQYWYII